MTEFEVEIPYYPDIEADKQLMGAELAKHDIESQKRSIHEVLRDESLTPSQRTALHTRHKMLLVAQGYSTTARQNGGVWREPPRPMTEAQKTEACAIRTKLGGERLTSDARSKLHARLNEIYR